MLGTRSCVNGRSALWSSQGEVGQIKEHTHLDNSEAHEIGDADHVAKMSASAMQISFASPPREKEKQEKVMW